MKKIFLALFPLSLFLLFCAFTPTSSSGDEVFPETPPGSLTFIGDAGSPNLFTMNRWKFSRVENVDQPTEIGITAVFDMVSISCDWKELETNLHKKRDYFNSSRFATASLNVDGASLQEDGSYLAQAILELKGVRKEIPISFTLDTDEEGVPSVAAEAVIMRREWRFTGNGPKDEVPVTVSAQLIEFAE
ncbi:MAG: YceI family protein [Bacteroidota bacterium]